MSFHKIIHVCNISCIFHHRLIENMVGLIANKNADLMEKIEIISKKTLREKILTRELNNMKSDGIIDFEKNYFHLLKNN